MANAAEIARHNCRGGCPQAEGCRKMANVRMPRAYRMIESWVAGRAAIIWKGGRLGARRRGATGPRAMALRDVGGLDAGWSITKVPHRAPPVVRARACPKRWKRR